MINFELMNNLKKHWDISSNNQLILILLVFAVNGSLSGIITKPFVKFLGINKDSFHIILYGIIYLLIISIIYFTLLIIISKIFGQSKFFKKFAKKSLTPLGFGRLFN